MLKFLFIIKFVYIEKIIISLFLVLTQNIDYFRSKPMNIPKITILLEFCI